MITQSVLSLVMAAVLIGAPSSYFLYATWHPGNPIENPNDPFFDEQWSLSSFPGANITGAWNYEGGTKNITIAALDTGLDVLHEDINLNCLQPVMSCVIWDGHGHGTHVTGSIYASHNNLGVVGAAPGISILPIKALTDIGAGTFHQVGKSVRLAADLDVDIISMSLGANSCPKPHPFWSAVLGDCESLHEDIQYAYERGVLIIAAAGNDGSWCENCVSVPAAFPEVVAVAALTSSGERASYSSYGPEVEIAAPGSDVLSTVPEYSSLGQHPKCKSQGYGSSQFSTSIGDPLNGVAYCRISGTSMATPHVAAAAALLWSHCPGLSPDSVRMIITSSAKDLGSDGWDVYYGHGALDAGAALEMVACLNE